VTSSSFLSSSTLLTPSEDSSAPILFTDYWLSAVLVLGNLQSLRP
jgi:hypothetical protein